MKLNIVQVDTLEKVFQSIHDFIDGVSFFHQTLDDRNSKILDLGQEDFPSHVLKKALTKNTQH